MFELPNSHVIHILGADAEKVINNLCTNDIKKLAVGACCEAFITNVRGWCVEHGFVVKLMNEIWLIGQFGNSTALGSHVDRYIIREDAKITDVSASKCVFLLSEQEADLVASHLGLTSLSPKNGSVLSAEFASRNVTAVSVQLLTASDVLLVCDKSERLAIIDAIATAGISLSESEEFEKRRIASFWPLAGREILEKSIPQELDRDQTAISFTKGCYLGQETIARLDAIGQVQKKLCLVRIDSLDPPEPGSPLLKGDQQVGQITSASLDPLGNYVLALAYLRRGNFEAGLQVICQGEQAVVLSSGRS